MGNWSYNPTYRLIGLITLKTRFVVGRAGAIFWSESRVDCIFWCSEILNHRSKNQKGSWGFTSKGKHGLFASPKKQATTSRHKNSPTYCTRGNEITTKSPQNYTKKNRGGRTTLCRNKNSTNFQTLGSPCCNWWSSWLSLLSLWIGRQDLHVVFVQAPVASYSFHCWLRPTYTRFLYTCS